GAVERVDRTRLADRVRTAEQGFCETADGRAEVLQLKEVTVGIFDVDPLAVQLEVRLEASEGIRHDHSSLGSDRLERRALGKIEGAVKLGEGVLPEPKQGPETKIDTGRTDMLETEHRLGLSREQA